MRPVLRVRLAWALLVATLVGWPASLVLTNEPATILSLSWLALTLTCLDIVATADVRAANEPD